MNDETISNELRATIAKDLTVAWLGTASFPAGNTSGVTVNTINEVYSGLYEGLGKTLKTSERTPAGVGHR